MSAPSEAPEHNSNAADNAVFEECSAKCWDASAPSEGAPTPEQEAAAQAAHVEMCEDRKAHGQTALVWHAEQTTRVLLWRGSVIQFEDEIDELFEWCNQSAPSDGLWIWEGWAYITEGSYEEPHDREMVIGGEFRRLTVEEMSRVASGEPTP